LGGGVSSTDLVALMQPAHYFQSRQIELSLDKMVELAGRDPKDPKTQIQQLVALRHLADESDKLKKAASYATLRAALEPIAQGKKAADSTGFAAEYAQRVLQKLDNARPADLKAKPIRQDALEWFPSDTRFAVAVDMRQSPTAGHDPLRDLLKMLPDQAKTQMHDHFEKCGNVRVERFAFGYVDAKERGKRKIYLRFTGKANHEWCVDFLKNISKGDLQFAPVKSADGARITQISERKGSPAILGFGNTDVLIVGYEGFDGKNEELVAEALDVRSKKKPSANAGPLKDALGKVPDKAIAFLAGEVPSDVAQGLRGGLGAMPEKVLGFAERTQIGVDVQLKATMANGDDTRAFVQKVGELRKQGIDGLQQVMKQPLPPGSPAVPFQAIINLLESLQVQGQDGQAQVRVVVPDGLLQQMGSMGMMVFGHAGNLPPPPPPPVEVKKN
jgi:hypothetical protein